jgi:hypothetical protein
MQDFRLPLVTMDTTEVNISNRHVFITKHQETITNASKGQVCPSQTHANMPNIDKTQAQVITNWTRCN